MRTKKREGKLCLCVCVCVCLRSYEYIARWKISAKYKERERINCIQETMHLTYTNRICFAYYVLQAS